MKSYIINLVLLSLVLFSCTPKQKARALVDKGNSAFKAHHLNEAFDDYTAALKLDSVNQDAYLGRGYVELETKKYFPALQDARNILGIDAKNLYAISLAATAQGSMKDYEAQIDYCSQGISIYPDNDKLYFARAGAKDDIRDLSGALADYDHAISLKHDVADYYYFRAMVKSELKDKSGACADFNKAWKLGQTMAKDSVLAYCN